MEKVEKKTFKVEVSEDLEKMFIEFDTISEEQAIVILGGIRKESNSGLWDDCSCTDNCNCPTPKK